MLTKLIELAKKINSLNHEEVIKEIEKTKLEMKLQESTRGVVDFETTLKATNHTTIVKSNCLLTILAPYGRPSFQPTSLRQLDLMLRKISLRFLTFLSIYYPRNYTGNST